MTINLYVFVCRMGINANKKSLQRYLSNMLKMTHVSKFYAPRYNSCIKRIFANFTLATIPFQQIDKLHMENISQLKNCLDIVFLSWFVIFSNENESNSKIQNFVVFMKTCTDGHFLYSTIRTVVLCVYKFIFQPALVSIFMRVYE